jgi:hypothetical protein
VSSHVMSGDGRTFGIWPHGIRPPSVLEAGQVPPTKTGSQRKSAGDARKAQKGRKGRRLSWNGSQSEPRPWEDETTVTVLSQGPRDEDGLCIETGD